MNDQEIMQRHAERAAASAADKPKPAPGVAAVAPVGLPIDLGKMFTGRTRDRICGDCGKPFQQFELSEAFRKIVAAQSPRIQEEWNATVSDNALPLFCTSCERKDLGRLHRPPAFKRQGGVGYGD